MTDEAARERDQWPGGGRAHGEPGSAYGTRTDQYGPDAQPVSGGYSGSPVSGGYAGSPTSGAYSGASGYQDAAGYQGAPGYQDASGYQGAAGNPAQRRIEPTPAPRRSKAMTAVVAGLLAGALAGGAGAFYLGRSTAGDPAPAAPPQPAAVGQVIATNKAKFPADMQPLAEPWLADMSGCIANTEDKGPKLGTGERTHVLCRDGGMYLHFVAYESADARAADLSYRQQSALNSAGILPGVEQPGRKNGGITGASGTYVEYATRQEKAPALCGVWWNRDNSDMSVYVDIICDSLGGSWDPLRAVWQRHS